MGKPIVGEGTELTRLLIEAGLLPDMAVDYDVHVPFGDIATVTWRCYATSEMLEGDMAKAIVDIGRCTPPAVEVAALKARIAELETLVASCKEGFETIAAANQEE